MRYPRLFGAVTDEQQAQALQQTREVATAVRDLVRSLDLPAECFGHVMAIYNEQCHGLLEVAQAKVYEERTKKVREIIKARTSDYPPVRQVGGRHPMPISAFDPAPGLGIGVDFSDLDDCTDDELNAMYEDALKKNASYKDVK